MSIDQNRQPGGIPAGGRYATARRNEPNLALVPAPKFAPIDDEVVRAHAEARVADHAAFVAERVLASIRQSVGRFERQIVRTVGPIPKTLRVGRATAIKLAAAAEATHLDAVAAAELATARANAATAAYPWAGDDPAAIFTMPDGIQRPVTVAPSGLWGFYTPPAARPPGAGPVAGLAWTANGQWVGAPGYHARTMADHDPTRPFGYIERASLSVQDTAAYVAFARAALESQEQM